MDQRRTSWANVLRPGTARPSARGRPVVAGTPRTARLSALMLKKGGRGAGVKRGRSGSAISRTEDEGAKGLGHHVRRTTMPRRSTLELRAIVVRRT